MASRFSNANRFEVGGTVTGQLLCEIEHYTISMLVIGSSGVGKSMFCNFLAQTETLFAESCRMESVTDRVEYCVKRIGREKVLLLDSPGFNDSIKSNEGIIEKISETAILTRDGVDVIAIVVNPIARFSTNDKNTLKIIERLGGNMWEHTFIIFTHASRIEKYKNKSEEYIKQMEESVKCPKELQEILKEADHRYIWVESVDKWGDEEYWQWKSKEVIEMIKRLRDQNKGTRYKNKIMSMGLEGYKIVKRLEKESIEKNEEIERLYRKVELQKEKGIDQGNEKNGSVPEESAVTSQTSNELVIRSHELEPYTISMLVIGAAGVGKSMLCSFLSQTETLFVEACGFLSVTDRVEHCVKIIEGEKVLIVDSPGFNDPVKSNEEIVEKISETTILTRDGVDVIAIVVNPTARFSPNDVNILKMIESLGGNMWEHAFIIFNNASRIEKRFKKKPEEYIKQMEDNAKSPKELQELLKEAGHRYICVESVDRWGDENYWQCKSKEVVEMIKRLKNQNKGKRYKNMMMSMGPEGYKRIERLEKKNIEKNKEIERLIREVELQKEKIIDQGKDIQELQKKMKNVQINASELQST